MIKTRHQPEGTCQYCNAVIGISGDQLSQVCAGCIEYANCKTALVEKYPDCQRGENHCSFPMCDCPYSDPVKAKEWRDSVIDAADHWIYKNKNMRSNNNNEVGDNYVSFLAGAEWAKKHLIKSNGMEIIKMDKNFAIRLCAFIDKSLTESGIRDVVLKNSDHYEHFEELTSTLYNNIKSKAIEFSTVSSSV